MTAKSKAFGEWFRSRLTAGPTELARQTGISKQSLHQWMHGRAMPQMGRAFDVAAALGVGEDELLRAMGVRPVVAKERPLSALQSAVWAAVSAEPGQWTVKGLAQDLDVKPQAVVCAVRKLRARGHTVILRQTPHQPKPQPSVPCERKSDAIVRILQAERVHALEVAARARCTRRYVETVATQRGLRRQLVRG